MSSVTVNLERNKAVKISIVCVATYLVSYFTRNLLSVCTPMLLETGNYTKESIAVLSSIYMIVYAAGQLINGTIGDYVKPKFMAALGLCISGTGLILFPYLAENLQFLCFTLLGFGLSMLRGPLVKTVSENTKPGYARVCCVTLSVTAFAGPLLASLAAVAFSWNKVFVIAGIISFVFAIFAFFMFTRFEIKGMIHDILLRGPRRRIDLLVVFKLDHFAIYLFLAMVIEALISSVGFWIPTYLTEYLGYSTETAGGWYSFMSLLKSICPLLCLAIVALFHDDCFKMMGVMFAATTLFFLTMLLFHAKLPSVLILTVARVFSGFASATMWTIYIPSLGKSGRVSSANGVLDCCGYIGASAANVGLAYVIERIGWEKVPLSFAVISFLGVALCVIGIKARKER